MDTKTKKKLFQLHSRLRVLEDKKEANIDRFIIPVERRIAIVQDEISELINT